MIRSAFSLLLSIAVTIAAHAACPAVSFEAHIGPSTTSGGPYFGSNIDVNADGRDDLTVYNNDAGGFQTFLADADGTLLAAPVHVTTSISDVDVDHLDADAFADAVQTHTFPTFAIRVYKGLGNGTYVHTQSIPVSFDTTSLEIADINADGRNDILGVLSVPGKIAVALQNPDGTFTALAEITVPVGLGDPSVADLDGDGHLDMAMMSSNGDVAVLYGNGDGTFDPIQTVAVPPPGPGEVSSGGGLAVGDFNGDDRLDLAAGRINIGVEILLNTGSRTFTYGGRVAPGAGARYVRAGDLNYDGRIDLAISTFGGFYTALGSATPGTFDGPVFWRIDLLSPTEDPLNWRDAFRFGIGDFRGDGRADLGGAIVPTFAAPPPAWIASFLNTCAPPPVLASLAPDHGPAEGGTTVTITGTSLLSTTQVLFGSTPATILTVTATAVTVQTPASTPSIVDVTVTTSGGTDTLDDAYRFMGATTTTVTTEPAQVIVGEPFQLVATISPAITGGTVTFMEGATVLGTAAVVNGRASIAATSSSIAPRTVTANFSGTPIYFPSSGSLTFRAFLPVEMTLSTSHMPQVNAPYRVTATLNPAVNGGTVTFTVNGTVAGTVPVTNGIAFIDLFASQAGPYVVEAAFSGFGDFAPETATISFQVSHVVPTLSEMALLALMAMLAMVAAMKLRG